MSDVGIFSINLHSFYLNYGAALHSFAFQKFLESKGVSSVIVDYKSKHFGNTRLDNFALTCLKEHKSIKTILNALFNTPSLRKKYKAFHKFYSKNCKMLDFKGKPFTYEDFNKKDFFFNFDFPIVVCESDVIWSPKTSKGFDKVFFCDSPCFKNKIKVAYSPSISNTSLNEEEKKEFLKLLNNFDYISCREKQTADYITSISGRKCLNVLDPVLLFDSDFYEPYMEKQNLKNYLLVYNVMLNDKGMLKTAKKIAKEKHLRLVEISDFVRNKVNHKTLTGQSIGQFLWLIKNADYFITNGFHGMCFAILFKKDFLIFERDGFDIKVKSLLDLLNISNCFVQKSKINQFKNVEFIDWENVYKNLEIKINISKNYIKNSIIENLRGGQKYSINLKHNFGGLYAA